jgi:hypothetical protein
VIGAMPSTFIRANAIALLSIFILLLSSSFIFRVPNYAILSGKIDMVRSGDLVLLVKQQKGEKGTISVGQEIAIGLTDAFGADNGKITGQIAAVNPLREKPGFLWLTVIRTRNSTSAASAAQPSGGVECTALVSLGRATLFSRIFGNIFRLS